jgi:hypothetical protein
MAVDAHGVLWDYPGRVLPEDGTIGGPPERVGSGWSAFTAVIAVSEFEGATDGRTALIARTKSGQLLLYRSEGAPAKWYAAKVIGSGWSSFTSISSPGDLSGDGIADIVARDSSGRLWLYPGTGSGSLGARKQIGSGWNSLRIVG